MSSCQELFEDSRLIVNVACNMADQGRFNLGTNQGNTDPQISTDSPLSSVRIRDEVDSSNSVQQLFGLVGNELEFRRVISRTPQRLLHPRHRRRINKPSRFFGQIVNKLETHHSQNRLIRCSNFHQFWSSGQRFTRQQLPKTLIRQRCNNPLRLGWQLMLKAEFHVLSLVLKLRRGGRYATSF